MWSDICGGGLKSEKGSFLQNNIIKIIPITYIYIYILLLLLSNVFFSKHY